DFFDYDPRFRVKALLRRSPKSKPFEMPTTTERRPLYREYGKLYFHLDDTAFILTVYQNMSLMKMKEYEDYLFLPFTDGTNGSETYGGGRFLDLRIPEGDTVLIDFNRAYNPYCAYNHKYSCPIPPAGNALPVEI